ncbi:MAG: hypothetical protein OXI12_05460 [Gammaproteobacteria bacterium]|nr:hypothetical protein [Gammaproteobacteria bacterium]
MKIRATAAFVLILLPTCADEGCRDSPDYPCLIESALEMAEQAPPNQRVGDFEMIAKAQALLGDIDGALTSMDRITASSTRGVSDDELVVRPVLGQDPRVVIPAMQAKKGDFEDALATAERFGVVREAWSAIALFQQAAGDSAGVARTLERALEAADTSSYTYKRPATLAWIAAFAERIDATEHVLRAVSMARAQDADFLLNDGAVLGVASALTGVGETQMATEIISSAQERAMPFGDAVGSVLVLQSRALAWMETGEVARAAEVMALAEATARNIDLAVQLTAGFAVAAGWAEIGRRDEALAMVDVIIESAGSATIDDRLGSFAREQIARNDLETARAVAGRMPDGGERNDVVAQLVLAYAEHEEVAEALDVAREVLESSSAARYEYRDYVPLRSIGVALAEIEALEAALTLADRMEQAFASEVDQALVRVAVARAHANAGDAESAKAILIDVLDRFDYSLKAFARSSDPYMFGKLLGKMGTAFALAGDRETASSMYAEAVSAASQVEAFYRSPTLTDAWERWPLDADMLSLYKGPDGYGRLFAAVSRSRWQPEDRVRARPFPGGLYARGLLLREISCAARTAGIPLAQEALRQAAAAAGENFKFSVTDWTLRAVAMALAELPCTN